MSSNLFNFMIFLGLEANYFYEDKNSLNVESFHNYRICLCNELTKYFDGFYSSIPDELKKALEKFLNTNLNMDIDNEINYLTLFIKEYGEYFCLKNGVIYLKQNKDMEDILKEKENCYTSEYDTFIAGHLMHFYDSENSLKALNAKKIKNELDKLLRMESVIEEYYCNEDLTHPAIKNQIDLGNLLIQSEIIILSKLPKRKKKCLYRLIQDISSKKYYDMSLHLISDKLEALDEFYEENDYIDSDLSNIFQQAIFSGLPLNYLQVENYIEELINEDNSDTFENDVVLEEESLLDDLEDDTQEELNDFGSENLIEKNDLINLLFYLSYLKKINCYDGSEKNYELKNVAKRLQYVLNQYDFDLYEKLNWEKVIQAIKDNMEFEYEEDFYEFYVISKLFLTDILNEWSENKDMDLRKIVFISTYYGITNDKRIIETIKPFFKKKKREIAEKVYNAVIANQYNLFDNSNKYQKKKKKDNEN